MHTISELFNPMHIFDYERLNKLGQFYRLKHYFYRYKKRGPTYSKMKRKVQTHYLKQIHRIKFCTIRTRLTWFGMMKKLLHLYLMRQNPEMSFQQILNKIKDIWGNELEDETRKGMVDWINSVNEVYNARLDALYADI